MPLPNIKKSYYIIIMPANKIRFLREIKVSMKHYYPLILNIMCATHFVTSITMPDP